MDNLQLTEDQELIVDTVRKFVAESVAPTVIADDEQRSFARAGFDGLAELGLFGMTVGEDAGGAGMGIVPLVASLESIGSQSASLARLFLGQVQCALVCEAVGATDRLEGAMMGDPLAVYLGDEHGFVSNGGKLEGRAELVPGGGEAGLFVVAATEGEEPALCALDGDGTERSALRSLGLSTSAPASVTCRGVEAAVLARGDSAVRAIALARFVGRVGVAAAALGGAKAAIDVAHGHARQRIAFGKPLLAQQAVVQKIVETKQRIEAARQVTWQAARLFDLGRDASGLAAQARSLAVGAAIHAADEAIQIMGGFGYTVEYHAERHYRDAMTFEVLDGGPRRLRTDLAAPIG